MADETTGLEARDFEAQHGEWAEERRDGSRAATAHLSVVMVCRELVGWSIRYHARAGEDCSPSCS